MTAADPAAMLAADLSRVLDRRVATAAVAGRMAGSRGRLETATGPVFLKLAGPDDPALDAEARGLALLAEALDATGLVRVPQVLGAGRTPFHRWLALEWLDLQDKGAAPVAEARLGEGLAMLHRVRAPAFGLDHDNTLGATPQANGWLDDWPAFLRERRLAPLLARVTAGGAAPRLALRGALLLEQLPAFFNTYRPATSLIHGDLWAGNWGVVGGEPVLFDPAVHHADRECDLAMTKLFGGFGPRFHTAYVASWPLDQAAGARRGLYQLYHVLNHALLFGGEYLAQAEGLVDRALSEVGR